MGNSTDKPADNAKFEKAMQKFQPIQDLKHPQLLNVKIFELKDNQGYTIFQSQKMTTSEQEFNACANHYRNRKTYQHENLVKILYLKTIVSSQMCSDSSQIVIIGEYFPNSLAHELEQNANQGQIFNESRLWFIAYQIVQGCAFLESKGRYHGDLRPEYIYQDNEGTIKLIEYNLIYQGMNSYQIALTTNNQLLLSPELLEALKTKQARPNIDYNKSDVFALGISLLELATLHHADIYYDWNNKTLNRDILNKAVNLLRETYSPMLANLIGEMVAPVEDRPGMLDLQGVLSNFEGEILSHSPFYQDQNLKYSVTRKQN